MDMVEEASIATEFDDAAMAEHRQGPLRPWIGRRSGRQATIGMWTVPTERFAFFRK